MDLSTNYLGFQLPHPLMPGAAPMAGNLDIVKRLEDAGAAAIVMHSLFEEQITMEETNMIHQMEVGSEAYAESLSYFPKPNEYHLGPEEYLELIGHIKKTVSIPVIASLNGVTSSGWVNYAKKIQQAGADALELNVYYLATDPLETCSAVEGRAIEVLQGVKHAVKLPVAIKLSPFYTALTHFGRELDQAGVDGIVIFNRFYQPDIDLETLEVVPNLVLSNSNDLRLPLRWIAILYGRIQADLALTSGVHTAEDVLKSMMAGANVAMMTSELLQHGFDRLPAILADIEKWMEDHEYTSIQQMRGSLSQKSVKEPAAFERANYMKILNSYKSLP